MTKGVGLRNGNVQKTQELMKVLKYVTGIVYSSSMTTLAQHHQQNLPVKFMLGVFTGVICNYRV